MMYIPPNMEKVLYDIFEYHDITYIRVDRFVRAACGAAASIMHMKKRRYSFRRPVILDTR